MTEITFHTPDGISVPAVSAPEMREIDRVAVEEFGIDLLQMMENAGRNLAWHVRDLGTDVTVVAGNGGNGGGGLVCARHLHNRDVSVRIVLDRPPPDLDGAAAHQYAILDEMAIPVAVGPDTIGDTSVIVDTLIGYGLTGTVHGPAADMVAATNDATVPVVSLDVPSGRNATTGESSGNAVDPDRIVTLALPKTGLRTADADLYLADISIPAVLYEHLGIVYETPFEDRYWVAIEA